MRPSAWLLGLAILVMSGCSNSARLVSSDSLGGCVAVANNSDSWPNYNITKAKELMNKECPKGYRIIRQEEVPIGQEVVHNTQRETKDVPLVKGVSAQIQQTRNTTEVHTRTEYRIWYEKVQ
jgi:hypothetical protein